MIKQVLFFSFFFFVICIHVFAQTFPNPASLSTGQGAQGTFDPVWTVSNSWYYSNPPNPMGLGYSPALINSNCAPGNWVDPTTLPAPVNNGNWITGADAPCSTDTSSGYRYFRLTLNLPADCNGNSVTTPGTYVLNLEGYVDNLITDVFVNGTSTGINGGSFAAGSQLNITLNGPWVPGINYVDVQVFNGHEYPPAANPYGLLMVANTNTPSFYCSPYVAPNNCNTTLIRNTLVAAGNTELQGMDNTCSLYFINPQYMDGPAAEAYAQSFGANLISVQSAAENTALTSALSNQGYAGDVIWIGFIRTFPGGPFVWSDSSAISYTNWAPGEPNNAGGVEGCTQIYANGQWNDLNCTGYNSLSVIEVNLCPVATIRMTKDTVCSGQSTTMNVSTILGAAPYTYTWTSVPAGFTSNSATVTVSPSVTTVYNVTSVDRYGCTASTSATVYSDAYSVTTSQTNVSCFGLNNGTASAAVTGGLTTFTYTWLPIGGGAATANSLTAQTYTVQINDQSNCSASATLTITQPPVLTLTATTASATCFGLSNGSSAVTVSGGVGPYLSGINTIPPQGGPTAGTETFSGLSAGSYTIGAQDANNCQVIFPILITEPPVLKDSITASTDVSCFGGNNGSATAGVTGGTPPYLAGWSNNTLGYTASALTAGTYTFGVQDAHGCQDTVSVNITQPTALVAAVSSFTNVSCYGLPNGSALGSATGGTAPDSYLWSNGNTSIKDTALAQGTYILTVSDANHCTSTASVSISQPPLLKDSISAFNNVSCFGLSDGSATAGVTGGTPPYLAGWSNSTIGYTASSLAIGSYTFGVQDAQGCRDSVSISITQPPVLKDSITNSVNVSCFGLHDGSATAGVKGGTAPYAAGWSNNTLGYTASNLAAGTYTFGVQDSHGCQDTVSVNITQPAVLQDSSLTFINDSCNGDHNGSATAFFSGGTLPYTYTWSPSGGNLNTAANLAAGIYTLTATDGHACQATASVTIHQPPVLHVTSSPKLICISNTATLTALATGGNTVQPYSYLWSSNANSVTAYTAAVSPVVTTGYSVWVTDVKGCKDSVSVVVSVRDSLKFLAVSPSVERCPGFSASLNATGGGGDSTFTYVWNPGGTASQNITVSPAATTVYTVTLSDACGTPPVKALDTVTINPLPAINFSADQTNGCYPLCVQFTNSTSINPAENISYNWTLGAGYTSTADNPLQCYNASGVYSVSLTATSAKGCISKKTVSNMITVYPHPKADFTYSPQDPTIIAPTIQFTDASTASGSSIAGLLWTSFGDGGDSTSMSATPTHTYRDTGTYCVTLIASNALGCKDTVTECLNIKPYFTVYIPNTFTPNGDGRNEVFNVSGEYISTLDMKIYDRWGSLIFHSTNINNGWTGSKGSTAAQEDVYVYIIHVTDPLRNPYSYKGTVTLIR